MSKLDRCPQCDSESIRFIDSRWEGNVLIYHYRCLNCDAYTETKSFTCKYNNPWGSRTWNKD